MKLYMHQNLTGRNCEKLTKIVVNQLLVFQIELSPYFSVKERKTDYTIPMHVALFYHDLSFFLGIATIYTSLFFKPYKKHLLNDTLFR